MAETNSKPYGLIYLVTNKVTGKVYIGQTISTIAARWKGHCGAWKGSRLRLSIETHGRAAFSIEKIDEALDKNELDDLERFYIAAYGATNKEVGYNFQLGGAGKPISKDASERAAAKLRGRKVPRDSVEKMAATKRGRDRTEAEQAVLDRMTKTNTGRRHTEEARKKMSDAVTGRKMRPATEEHRAKLSAASKAMWVKKKAMADKVPLFSAEHRAKISASAKARWEKRRLNTN